MLCHNHKQSGSKALRIGTVKNKMMIVPRASFATTKSFYNVLRTLITITLLFPVHQESFAEAWSPQLLPKNVGRRGAFKKIASLTAGIFTAAKLDAPETAVAAEQNVWSSNAIRLSPPTESGSSSFDAYYLTPVENYVRSKLDKIDGKKFLNQLASHSGGSIWLGEHHNSVSDHNFQAMVIREVHTERKKHRHLKDTPMAIGLEQVQTQFQPVLDDYISGKVSLSEMKSMVQWDKRWTWSFENYKEIFLVAKDLGIQLLALNVDSEDLELVEKAGYPGLPVQQLHKYIRDP